MEAIECHHVSVRRDKQLLFTRLDLKLGVREKLAVVGPNGCGKTTLLRTIAGLLRPDEGMIKIFGKDVWPKDVKNSETFYMASLAGLYLDLSLKENAKFYFGCYQKTWDEVNWLKMVEKVGLRGRENQIVKTLSLGQQKRLVLSYIACLKPKLVIADEPSNGLDDAGQKLLLEIFDVLRAENQTTFLIATHEEFLQQWCDTTLNLGLWRKEKKTSHTPSVEKFW